MVHPPQWVWSPLRTSSHRLHRRGVRLMAGLLMRRGGDLKGFE